ncbi:hypothetical protein [Coralloluteibacterium thermophilus]|uniref:Polymerase/histidinol phosphatase N-terminal domain-containing protein n=1 Tax=Coralloluteibacterium thermophilum TaxID=2707049 RepID=A0ABV9NJY2_9GAMM
MSAPHAALPSASRRTRARRGLTVLAAALCALAAGTALADDREWLAGDHHVHSEWSVTWDWSTYPPKPIRGGDSEHAILDNARQAHAHGLSWMVSTDHGGPGHSRVNAQKAYPALLEARAAVPELMIFYGMEFDVPAAEHASLIIPIHDDERDQLFRIESGYNRREVHEDPSRNTEAFMLEALAFMRALDPTPVLFVNHPSRTATAHGAWGDVTPRELRAWQDAAPEVLVGMEGAPGHQASRETRGLYRNAAAPTYGGFDQMTATVGGVWDGMLAEGRRFWITATSDSHVHASRGGADFHPGEYSKTWIHARRDPAGVLDALRAGRMFVATGDLVDRLELEVSVAGEPARMATLGERLEVPAGADVHVRLALRQPARNANGPVPPLHHVELIEGRAGETAPVMHRMALDAGGWERDGEWIRMEWRLEDVREARFVRVRGTNTDEMEPQPDVAGEDPWEDLWFYSNPVFIAPADAGA